MPSNSFLIFFLLGAILCFGNPVKKSSNCGASYVERVCGENQTTLWLDIVIVVDNSKGMTDGGVIAVAAEIISLFVDGQQIGIQSNNPMTTRVGIVTYNTEATVVADLNKFTSLDDLADTVSSVLNEASDVEDSYLYYGLDAANELLKEQSFGSSRDHYKKLVIVYASEYKGFGQQDPLPLSNRMKATIAISTVAYNQDNSIGFLEEISKIATPGYNFTNGGGENTVGELRTTMLQVNCYCPNEWYQFRQSFSNENSFKYGTCLKPITLQSTYTASKFSCRNQWNKGYLVNEYSQTKHDYVLQVVNKTSTFTQPYTYYIGLSYSKGAWQWEQPVGVDPIPVGQWTDWNPGYPQVSSTATAGINVQTSSSSISAGWQNVNSGSTFNYVCEVQTCDSTNYCKSDKI